VKRSQILFHNPTLDMYWTWLSKKKSQINEKVFVDFRHRGHRWNVCDIGHSHQWYNAAAW